MSLAAPLSDSIRKSLPKQLKWTDKCQEAFVKLKDCLCKAPVLSNPLISVNRLCCRLMRRTMALVLC